MEHILKIALIICLGLIAYQDFKTRAIHLSLFVIFILLISIEDIFIIHPAIPIKDIILNITILSVQLFLLLLYLILRKRKISRIINNDIGSGDIAMLYLMVFAFSTLNFIICLTFSLIFSLIIWSIIIPWVRQNKIIPLAGLLASFNLILFSLDYMIPFISRWDDSSLIRLLYG
jgi:hypothetical protein